jgi:hypothetical protein
MSQITIFRLFLLGSSFAIIGLLIWKKPENPRPLTIVAGLMVVASFLLGNMDSSGTGPSTGP